MFVRFKFSILRRAAGPTTTRPSLPRPINRFSTSFHPSNVALRRHQFLLPQQTAASSDFSGRPLSYTSGYFDPTITVPATQAPEVVATGLDGLGSGADAKEHLKDVSGQKVAIGAIGHISLRDLTMDEAEHTVRKNLQGLQKKNGFFLQVFLGATRNDKARMQEMRKMILRITADMPVYASFQGNPRYATIFLRTVAHTTEEMDAVVPPASSFYLNWRKNFASIFVPSRSPSSFSVEEQSRIRDFLDLDKWPFAEERPLSQKFTFLSTVLLDSLTKSAKQGLLAMSKIPIFALPYVFMVRMDCLLFLKRNYWPQIEADQDLKIKFLIELKKLRNPVAWPLHHMKLRYLDIFLETLPSSEGRKFLDDFFRTYPHLSWRPLLRLIDYTTQLRDVDLTLRLLQENRETLASAPGLMQRCTNLLELDWVEYGRTPTFSIFSRLLAIGIKPDAILHHLVLRNASDAGMSGVAWDLFRYMQDEKIEVSSYAYEALLKDALVRQNPQDLNEILSIIHRDDELSRNPFMVICVINTIRRVHKNERMSSPKKAFSQMLAVYSRAYNHNALRRLKMVDSSGLEENPLLPNPSPKTLAYMVFSYTLVQTQPHIVHSLWAWFQRLLSEGNPAIVEIAKYDVLWNGFLIFHGRSGHNLPQCLDVVQAMLQSEYIQPTEHTWYIVMCIFTAFGKAGSAETVRQLLLENGVRPTSREWTGLAASFPDSEIASMAQEELAKLENELDNKMVTSGWGDHKKDFLRVEDEPGAIEENARIDMTDTGIIGGERFFDRDVVALTQQAAPAYASHSIFQPGKQID